MEVCIIEQFSFDFEMCKKRTTNKMIPWMVLLLMRSAHDLRVEFTQFVEVMKTINVSLLVACIVYQAVLVLARKAKNILSCREIMRNGKELAPISWQGTFHFVEYRFGSKYDRVRKSDYNVKKYSPFLWCFVT